MFAKNKKLVRFVLKTRNTCVCIWSFLPPMDWIIHFLLLRKINKIGHENSIASAIGMMMNEQIYIHISSHSNINLINAISVHNHNLYIIIIKCMNIEGCNVYNWIPTILLHYMWISNFQKLKTTLYWRNECHSRKRSLEFIITHLSDFRQLKSHAKCFWINLSLVMGVSIKHYCY